MEIEADIKNIERGGEYKRLREDLRLLMAADRGGPTITFRSPDNPADIVSLRRGSSAVAEYIDLFKERMRVYDERVKCLTEEKARIEGMLFHRAVK